MDMASAPYVIVFLLPRWSGRRAGGGAPVIAPVVPSRRPCRSHRSQVASKAATAASGESPRLRRASASGGHRRPANALARCPGYLPWLAVRRAGPVRADDARTEPGHLLALRRELEQQQVDAGVGVCRDPVYDLRGRPDQAAAQPAVRNAVLLERDLRLQL